MSDPLVSASSEVIGGPLGRHARTGHPYRTWWLPVRVLLAVAFFASTLAFVADQHCRAADWQSPDMYTHICYSDIPALYTSRGLDQHRNPFTDFGEDGPIAQPVVANIVMYLTAWLIPSGTEAERRLRYYDTNALLAVIFLAISVLVAARLVDQWRDAIFVAIAPAGVLALFIGWDGLAVMLVLIGMLLYRRGSPWWAGIVIGLSIATAFYPIIVLVAFYLIGARSVGLTDSDRVIVAALATWGALDVVVAIFAFEGVTAFYQVLMQQGAAYGSLWLALNMITGWTPVALNLFWLGGLTLALAALITFLRHRRLHPTLGQAALLVTAIYFITAKTYSPQHVLLLIAMAALAGLRWRDLVIWQGIEVLYHVAIWQYLATISDGKRGLDADAYAWITLLHIAGLVYLIWRTLQQVSAEHSDLHDVLYRLPESPESHQPARP